MANTTINIVASDTLANLQSNEPYSASNYHQLFYATDTSALYRSDTSGVLVPLKDGDGIYTGGVKSVPDATASLSKSYPGAASDDSFFLYGFPSGSDYRTGMISNGTTLDGYSLIHLVDSSGNTIETTLSLRAFSEGINFMHNTILHNAPGLARGLNFENTEPRWQTAAATYIELPSTQPPSNDSVWVTDSDGTASWVVLPMGTSNLELGETDTTAYRGDRGKIAYDHSQLTSGNPHSVTKAEVGLGNVDNTSDINKPISTLQQAALDLKSDIGHTHVAADVTDFDTEVSNNPSVVANTAKVSNINQNLGVSGTTDPTLTIDQGGSNVDVTGTGTVVVSNASGAINIDSPEVPRHYQLEGTEPFDVTSILVGWTQPTTPVSGSTAVVEFENGTGRFSYDGSAWDLVQFNYSCCSQLNQITFNGARGLGGLVEAGGTVTYKGEFFRTYFTWMGDTDLIAQVAYYDHDTGLSSPVYDWGTPRSGANDTHAVPGIVITESGYIVLVQEQLIGTGTNAHNSSIHIRRSTNPEDITTWAAISGSPFSDGLSYVHINQLVNGTLILHMRRYPAQIKSFISTDEGVTWTNFNGTAIAATDSDSPAVVDLEDNFWAYHNTFELPDGIGLTVFPRTGNGGTYPITYALFTRDGIEYGNWLWYLGDATGWSKDVTVAPISKAELKTNCIIIDDSLIDNATVRNYAPRITVRGDYLMFTNDNRPVGVSATDTRFVVIDKTNTIIANTTITNNNPYTGLDIGLPAILPIESSIGHYFVFVRVSDGRLVQMRTNDNGDTFHHVRTLDQDTLTDEERAVYGYLNVREHVYTLSWINSDGILKSAIFDLSDGSNMINHLHSASEITDFDIEVGNNMRVLENTAKVSFPEAPQDGEEYVRLDGNWEIVTATGETNTINSETAGEPSGSDVVLNVVSLTQAEYDAGTPVSTTFYIITDA